MLPKFRQSSFSIFKDLTKPYVFSKLSQDRFEDNLSQKTIQFSLSSLLTQLMLIKVVIKHNFSETHCRKKSENKNWFTPNDYTESRCDERLAVNK